LDGTMTTLLVPDAAASRGSAGHGTAQPAFASPGVEAALGVRVEEAIRSAFGEAVGAEAPPRLREAMERAVFGGGARLRPSLCLAVAMAHADPNPRAAERAGAAVELVHCASLVHDDLPCFDDADRRRGQPTIHVAFGVPTAVLVGDALIVAAFGTLGRAGHVGGNAAYLVAALAEATGASHGIVAGQAWENEPTLSLEAYHRAKTASLFVAAASLGAQVSGADPRPWRTFGDALGRAYQATDDVLDALSGEGAAGKTTGRDESLGRPSAVRQYGVDAARERALRLLEQAAESVPSCPDERPVRAWLQAFRAKVATALGR
jgi:geranylgeranyl diphosphate synthase type II